MGFSALALRIPRSDLLWRTFTNDLAVARIVAFPTDPEVKRGVSGNDAAGFTGGSVS